MHEILPMEGFKNFKDPNFYKRLELKGVMISAKELQDFKKAHGESSVQQVINKINKNGLPVLKNHGGYPVGVFNKCVEDKERGLVVEGSLFEPGISESTEEELFEIQKKILNNEFTELSVGYITLGTDNSDQKFNHLFEVSLTPKGKDFCPILEVRAVKNSATQKQVSMFSKSQTYDLDTKNPGMSQKKSPTASGMESSDKTTPASAVDPKAQEASSQNENTASTTTESSSTPAGDEKGKEKQEFKGNQSKGETITVKGLISQKDFKIQKFTPKSKEEFMEEMKNSGYLDMVDVHPKFKHLVSGYIAKSIENDALTMDKKISITEKLKEWTENDLFPDQESLDVFNNELMKSDFVGSDINKLIPIMEEFHATKKKLRELSAPDKKEADASDSQASNSSGAQTKSTKAATDPSKSAAASAAIGGNGGKRKRDDLLDNVQNLYEQQVMDRYKSSSLFVPTNMRTGGNVAGSVSTPEPAIQQQAGRVKQSAVPESEPVSLEDRLWEDYLISKGKKKRST